MEGIYIFLIIFGAVIALLIIFWALRKMKGSIELIPDKFSYSSGETINGKIILKLKKPVSSENLIVGLRCEKTEKIYAGSSRGSQSRTVPIFDFNQPLEGAKEYAPSEYNYDFSIKIPQDVSQKLEGVAGTLVKSAQILMGQNSYARWYLYAELKCKGINLSKKIQINVV